MNNSQCYFLFQMGKIMSMISLQKGLCVSDLRPANFGIRRSTGEVVCLDFPSIEEITEDRLFSEDVGNRLTEAFLPCIRDLMPDISAMSYFRAGFVSYGGMMGHALFSNAVNKGLSVLEIIGAKKQKATFNARIFFQDITARQMFYAWKGQMFDEISKGSTMADYQEILQRNLGGNQFFADLFVLYNNRAILQSFKEEDNRMTTDLEQMALSAYYNMRPIMAYGLLQRYLFMKPNNPKSEFRAREMVVKIEQGGKVEPDDIAVIKDSLDRNIFEFLWILSELESYMLLGEKTMSKCERNGI